MLYSVERTRGKTSIRRRRGRFICRWHSYGSLRELSDQSGPSNFEWLCGGATLLRQLSDNVCTLRHRRGRGNRPMTPGQIGWFVAVAAIGIAIWYFKIYRKRPPQ